MLPPRLKTIFEFIPPCRFLADIGCDHGFIPIEAVNKGIAKHAAACDISEPSLMKADKNIRFSGLSEVIEARLGGGLAPLGCREADVIIIAGMGGHLIADILYEGFEKIGGAKLILQPMTNIPDLRRRLTGGGFRITAEKLAKEDRRIYTVITAEIGESADYDCDIGSALITAHDPLLTEWLSERLHAEEEILSRIPPENGDYIKHKTLADKYREVITGYEC